MGNEESTEQLPPNAPPQTLTSRDVRGLGKFIRDGHARNIVVMSGAGISTSAGIPDFRSPETGLYANLARLELPYAEAVFDISYFRRNPLPFYTLAQELYPGKYKPTITHSFIRLLNDKGLLLRHFTQNIDCLDREAGVPGDKIVEAHGSFAKQRCIECKERYPDAKMLEHVKAKEVPHCEVCGGLVKPDIVFFGEALPGEFFEALHEPQKADLVIVLGTSLTVHPFASLPGMAGQEVPRVLINLERVGGFGSRPDDVLLLGDCDDGVCKLAQACGWLDTLVELWKKTGGELNPKHPALNQPALEPELETKPAKGVKDKDEAVADEVEKLTADIDKSLKISKDHEAAARKAVEDAGGKKAIETNKSDKDSLDHVYPHIKKESSL